MRIGITVATESDHARAERLAAELDLPLMGAADPDADLVLQVSDEGLALHVPGSGAHAVRPDLRYLAVGRSGRDDLLRAALPPRAEAPHVADATAGMGTDGFLLAAAGARVTMIERSEILHALLRDALERASRVPAAAPAAARIALRQGDARSVLAELTPPAVVYLDPMYPDLGKRARKNKEMHLFRALVGSDPDAAELLEVALSVARWRVVVKRPAKAPPLAGRPTGAIRGRTVRFDLYPPAE